MANSFPIVEYGCYARLDRQKTVCALDLRRVAFVEKLRDGTASISFNGDGCTYLDVPYEDFMRDWLRAKDCE